MDNLTKEQQFLLISMYKTVLSRQPALSFEDANYFSDSDEVNELLDLCIDSDHISDLCWKLEAKGYIACSPGSDLANNISLTDETIILMENRFSRKLKEISKVLASLIDLLK